MRISIAHWRNADDRQNGFSSQLFPFQLQNGEDVNSVDVEVVREDGSKRQENLCSYRKKNNFIQ